MSSTLPPLASVSELEKRLGRTFDGPARDQAVSVLDEASDLVRAESKRDWLSSDDPTKLDAPPLVRRIALRVAMRAILNPDGLSAETAGDYSYQRNAVGADGSLYLTQSEKGWLAGFARRAKLWTQPVTRAERCSDIEWVNDQYGSEPIPIAPWPRW